jgi:PAS domain S-box-containing protein
MPTTFKSSADAADAHTDVRHSETLLKTGALQRAIFNSANFSSIATDAKGVIQIFNVGAERMLGYSAAEVVNTITPADMSDPRELIARATALSLEFGTPIAPGFEALVFKASRGIEDIYELTKVRKDGSRFPAVVSVTALRDAQDAIIGYLLIGTDNTARQEVEEERKRLDQRLRDQQFYTRSLIESNIDALMTCDPRGIITDVNKQTEALTGCTRDELIGAPFKDYFTDASRAEAGIKRVLAEGRVTNYELTACLFGTTASGSTCSTRTSCSESSSGSIDPRSSKAPASDWPRSDGSWPGTGAGSGLRARSTRAPRSTSRWNDQSLRKH